MPPQIPDVVPVLFTAGETVKFRRTLQDFSPSVWTYVIYFNGPAAVFSKAATADDTAFAVTLTPDDLAVPAGIYRYIERVTNSSTGEVYTAGEGVAQIEIDLATAPAGAALSFWEKTLDVVEAALTGRLTTDMQMYSIAGRQVIKIPVQELIQIRGIARANVWKAANPGRLSAPVFIDFPDQGRESAQPPTWVDVTGLSGAGQ